MSEGRWKKKDSCRGKYHYRTYAQAEMEIERAEEMRGVKQRAYECDRCGSIHLTEMSEEEYAGAHSLKFPEHPPNLKEASFGPCVVVDEVDNVDWNKVHAVLHGDEKDLVFANGIQGKSTVESMGRVGLAIQNLTVEFENTEKALDKFVNTARSNLVRAALEYGRFSGNSHDRRKIRRILRRMLGETK